MAEFVGKQCGATFTTAMANVLGWTFSANHEMVESTVANSNAAYDGKVYMAGYPSYTATVNTYSNALSGNAYHAARGTSATLQLYRVVGTVGSGYYEGTAILNNIETTADMRGIVATTYTFQFTGAVSFKTS
jgi:hypothetical protein